MMKEKKLIIKKIKEPTASKLSIQCYIICVFELLLAVIMLCLLALLEIFDYQYLQYREKDDYQSNSLMSIFIAIFVYVIFFIVCLVFVIKQKRKRIERKMEEQVRYSQIELKDSFSIEDSSQEKELDEDSDIVKKQTMDAIDDLGTEKQTDLKIKINEKQSQHKQQENQIFISNLVDEQNIKQDQVNKLQQSKISNKTEELSLQTKMPENETQQYVEIEKLQEQEVQEIKNEKQEDIKQEEQQEQDSEWIFDAFEQEKELEAIIKSRQLLPEQHEETEQ